MNNPTKEDILNTLFTITEIQELKAAWDKRMKAKEEARVKKVKEPVKVFRTYQRYVRFDPNVMTELEFMRRTGHPYHSTFSVQPWEIN